MRKVIVVCLFLLSSSLAHANLRLRPVDRATVRIISIGGAYATALESDGSKQKRFVAVPKAGHGTGVVIRNDGLILTAQHVIEGSDLVAVMLPGGDKAIPAKIVYSDPERDLAVLQAKGKFPDILRVAQSKAVVGLGDRVSTSGYPLDVSQRFPAAASGEVSRQTNSGYLQLSMSVNPGNSGGPVITASGDLLGILIRKGSTKSGIEGVAIVEPMEHVLRAVKRARAIVARTPASFDKRDEALAHIATRFVRAEADGRPIYDGTSVAILEDAAAAALTPEQSLIVASHAWNMHMALLAKHSAASVHHIPGEDGAKAAQLLDIAGRSAEDGLARAPYAVRLYSSARSIVNAKSRVAAGGAVGGRSTSTSPGAAHQGVARRGETASIGRGIPPKKATSTAPRWTLGVALATPTGDFDDAYDFGRSVGLSLRRGIGAFGLRLDGVFWNEPLNVQTGTGSEEVHARFFHLGADLRLAGSSKTSRVWMGGGLGLDVSSVDDPLESSFGLGLNLEIGVELPASEKVGVELSFQIHPGFTPFLGAGLSRTNVNYYALSTGLSFH